MSSHKRPWYQFCPKDFSSDEKVKSLSPIAELIYRRALDTMWEANACRLPNVCFKLAAALGKGLSQNQFEEAWNEIQYPGFECLETTEDDKWVYSKRLKEQADRLKEISEIRSLAAKKGSKANAEQMPSKCRAKSKQTPTDTDTDTDTLVSDDTKGRPCPHKKIIKLYHEILPVLPRVNVWDGPDKSALTTRWREDKNRQTLTWWKSLFENEIKASPWLMGEKTDWRADLGWIVKKKNFLKILNGTYVERNHPPGPDRTSPGRMKNLMLED